MGGRVEMRRDKSSYHAKASRRHVRRRYFIRRRRGKEPRTENFVRRPRFAFHLKICF